MKPVVTLVVYAVVLVVGGVIAFLSAPEGAKATTALVVPGACAAVVLVLAAMLSGRLGGEKGRRIGRRVAPVLLAVLTGLFLWRGGVAKTPDKAYLRTLLWVLSAASAVAGVTLALRLRRERLAGDQSSRT